MISYRPHGEARAAHLMALAWGSSRAENLTAIAFLGAALGYLGCIGVLPEGVLLVAVLGCVLIGPGGLIVSFYDSLPDNAAFALVPVVGLSVGILVVSGLLLLGVYAPLPILLAIATVTAAGACLRRRALVRRKGRTP